MVSRISESLLRIIEASHDKRLSFHKKLGRILDEVIECMNAEKGSIMLVRSSRILEVVASSNPQIVGVTQPLTEDTPSSWVFRNKRSLYIGPDTKKIPFNKRYQHYKKEAFLLVPIMVRNRVIGVISITEKKGEDCFNAEEQDILLKISGHVIVAIENQNLLESLRKSRDDIRRKNLELKNLERIRTELFNMLIHDLKGPLSEIVANLDILSYTTTDDNLECVNTAQSASDTLYRMISDLLDITRLEEGCLNLVYEKLNMADLIHEAVLRLNNMAKMRGIEMKESTSEEKRCAVMFGDRGILLRVLQNLIINAVQHSSPGSSVEAGFDSQGSTLIVHVKDSGPGIAPEYHEAIFNKFFQITRKHDGRRYSTGLGLTFCKMAVEAHEGSIHVESDGIKGSRFVFTLPKTVKKAPATRKKRAPR